MNLMSILEIVVPIGSAIIGFLPPLIALIFAIKARKHAESAEEIAKADKAMEDKAMELIESAEDLYHKVDAAMKAQGASAGLLKKDSVLSKLQDFALQANYNFNREFWSQKIDELVSFTKKVNAAKK